MATITTPRVISFEQAKAQYSNRFTMEHIPAHVRSHPTPRHSGGDADWFYAPQYATDREWYDNTTFPGEGDLDRRSGFCESHNPSWPLGKHLDAPYQKAA